MSPYQLTHAPIAKAEMLNLVADRFPDRLTQ